MNIKNCEFTVVIFSNKYGYYTCIRTPIDKDKSDFYKKYINIKFMKTARQRRQKIQNGDIVKIVDGWLSVWDEQLYLNINDYDIIDNIERKKRNGNEERKR